VSCAPPQLAHPGAGGQTTRRPPCRPAARPPLSRSGRSAAPAPPASLWSAGRRLPWAAPHAGQTLTVAASETTLAIELDDAETRVVRRTTTRA
jgi:hypothetical protein